MFTFAPSKCGKLRPDVFFDPVAQLVEQYTFNVWALGSNPSGITETSVLAGVSPFRTGWHVLFQMNFST